MSLLLDVPSLSMAHIDKVFLSLCTLCCGKFVLPVVLLFVRCSPELHTPRFKHSLNCIRFTLWYYIVWFPFVIRYLCEMP